MFMHRSILRFALFCASLSLPIAGLANSTSFSGRATGVNGSVDTPLGPQQITLSDTGALDSSGGARETSLLNASVPGVLSAEVLHATTVGQGNHSRSEASVANLNLTLGGNTVAVGLLMARAEADCSSSGASASGSSEIVALTVNGQSVLVTGAPNQPVTVGPVQLLINEQTSAGSGDITVNALHVVVSGIADIVVSSAHADITCGGNGCQAAGDFVTGGGWITGPSGAKANFAVAGGIKNGSLWGHLEYIDHGTGMKVHGTGVTAYAITGPTSRHIEGAAEINGQGGFTYQVDVADNGEPGRNDTFAIKLSNRYTAGGTLQGGNIQLHDSQHACP